MIIRYAEEKDIEGIRSIYNEAIINSTSTFDTEPKSYEDRLNWLKAHNKKFPVIVAEADNQIIAWGALNQYSDRKAYDGTCELSIYVDKEYRGQGIGNMILEELIRLGRQEGLHVILSRVAGANEASKNLHKRYDFELVGIMKEVGYKFDRYIDVYLYQKLI